MGCKKKRKILGQVAAAAAVAYGGYALATSLSSGAATASTAATIKTAATATSVVSGAAGLAGSNPDTPASTTAVASTTAQSNADIINNAVAKAETPSIGTKVWDTLSAVGSATVSGVKSVVNALGPAGTAAVIGTTALTTSKTLSKVLPWAVGGLAAYLLFFRRNDNVVVRSA